MVMSIDILWWFSSDKNLLKSLAIIIDLIILLFIKYKTNIMKQNVSNLGELQNAVKELWVQEGSQKDNNKDLFRFPNKSRLQFGDFGITQEKFLKEFDEKLLITLDLVEENGVIIIPTP